MHLCYQMPSLTECRGPQFPHFGQAAFTRQLTRARRVWISPVQRKHYQSWAKLGNLTEAMVMMVVGHLYHLSLLTTSPYHPTHIPGSGCDHFLLWTTLSLLTVLTRGRPSLFYVTP